MKNLINKLKAFKMDKKKIFLIALVALLILYVDFAFIIRSQLKNIKTLGPKIIRLKSDVDNLAKDLLLMQDLERRQGKDKQQIEAPGPKEIISEDKLLVLLQDISDFANKHRVKIMQINTSKDTKAKEEVIAGLRLLPINITLDLSCGYHSLGNFINALENARKFIEVQDMKIIRDRDNYLLQKVNLVLKTYAKK